LLVADPIIPARPGIISIPPVPDDLDSILNISYDTKVGVQLGYMDKSGRPRLRQYSYQDYTNVVYDLIFDFWFTGSGGRAPRGAIILPALPRDCEKVLSIVNGPKTGVVVGYLDKDQRPCMVQYVYSTTGPGEVVYDRTFNYKFEDKRSR